MGIDAESAAILFCWQREHALGGFTRVWKA